MTIKHLIALPLLLLALAVHSQNKAINVGVMLPLHNVDGDGRRMVEYYRGMLMAVEKLKAEGKNINIHAWNVPIDADIQKALLKDGATECQYIFGPLYSKQVKAMGDFCKAYNVKMVIPFSITGNDVDKNSQIYQVYESSEDMNASALKHVAEHCSGYHPVFIDCNDTTSRKGAFTFALRKILEQRGTKYNITNLKSSDDMFAKAFSLTQPNIVILNTGRSPELTQALNKLDVLLEANKNVKVMVFGYTEWLMYVKYNNNKERFSKYDVQIPTNFYFNENSTETKEFMQKYRWRFHEDMLTALPHFAITGYDHAMYFLGNRRTWMQSPLDFQRQGSGGYRNKAFMVIHYKQNGGVEALTY